MAHEQWYSVGVFGAFVDEVYAERVRCRVITQRWYRDSGAELWERSVELRLGGTPVVAIEPDVVSTREIMNTNVNR
jgi:hypothetical protein